MTTIALDMPVHDLVAQHPDIVTIMVDMGLDGVINPSLLNTVGRFMTLEKGAKMKHIPLAELIAKLEQAGYEVANHD